MFDVYLFELKTRHSSRTLSDARSSGLTFTSIL
jgi:hypothetical protein